MGMWRSLHPFKPTRQQADLKRARRRRRDRPAQRRGDLALERFEERCLLTSGPILLSITANDGSVILPNTPAPTFNADPTQFTLLFNEGEAINPSTLGGIELVRAGTDHQFGTPDDVTITPGFVGIGTTPNQVVMRFADPLPDDQYQFTILGTGPNELTDSSSPPNPFVSNQPGKPNLVLPFAIDVGPQVLSVVPQPVSRAANGTLSQSASEIDVYFNKPIAPLPLTVNQLDPSLFQLYYTADQANPALDDPNANPSLDGAPIHPASVSFDASTNMARLLFAKPINQYAVDPANPGTVLDGGAFRLRIGNSQSPSINPPSVVDFNDINYSGPKPGSSFANVTSPAFNAGVLNDVGAGLNDQVFTSQIGPVPIQTLVAYPGGPYGPGQRTIPDPGVESNTSSGVAVVQPSPQTPGTTPTIPTVTYNFPTTYGDTPGNTGLTNLISPEQEQLAREIFQLYSKYLGVQFQELSDESLGAANIGVVTGVVQAVTQTLPSLEPGVAGLLPGSTTSGLAVMNEGVFATESQYGGPWFQTAMNEIGQLLGLGANYEGPPGTVMGSGPNENQPLGGDGVFPGNADILHGQYLFQPQSNSIDLYKFTVTTPGEVTAETIAQRLPNASQLNTVLTLYDETNVIQVPGTGATPVGSNVVAGSTFTVNDGVNPIITFEFAAVPSGSTLKPGTLLADGNYAVPYTPSASAAHDVAVSLAAAVNNLVAGHTVALNASATVQFNQVVLNGPLTVLSQGFQGGVAYSVSHEIISRNDDYFGTDSFLKLDLSPGNYYIAVTSVGNTNFDPSVPNSGAGGTTQGVYDLKLAFTPTAVTNITDLAGNSLQGNSNGVSGGAYNFFFNVGNTIYVDKAAAPGGDGSLANPLNDVAAALSLAANRIIVPVQGGAWAETINGVATTLDGQTFDVVDDANPPNVVTFQFTSTGAVSGTNQPVSFSAADSQSDLANRIVSAIQNAVGQGLLAPGANAQVDVNGSAVDLLGTQSMDLRGAPALTPTGDPGVTKIVRIIGNSGPDNALGVPVNQAQANLIVAGDTFTITAGTLNALVFEFTTSGRPVAAGHLAVTLPASKNPASIAAAIAAAINASPLAKAAGGAIVASVPAIQPNDATAVWVTMSGVGQITVNAQATPALKASSNALAYQIGYSQFNNTPLADGSTFIVPQGVTVMIDAGAVLKFENANIDVGLTTPNIDRSGAALQVLGTPATSVFFTSFHDNSLGQTLDTVTAPKPGDWGGIDFQPSADLASQAIFLDNVNYGNFRYGGGAVGLSVPNQQIFNPIYISGSQPTITNNTITLSNDAAMSADPNAFQETDFGSSGGDPTQFFSLDYNRVGPDIQGNHLSIQLAGGLTLTAPAGSALVSGETFTIANPNQPPTATSAGGVFTFEFISGSGQTAGAVLPDGNFAVPFNLPGIDPTTGLPTPGDTSQQVATTIVSAIKAANIGIAATQLTTNGQLTNQVSVTGASNVNLTAPEFITAQPGSALADGQTFQIFDPVSGKTFVFEYNSVGGVVAGHVAVNFTANDADTTVAAAIAAAINGANIGATAEVVGNQVFLTGPSSFALSSSGASGLTISSPTSTVMPLGSNLQDGTTFKITNTINSNSITFEFDSDPTPNPSGSPIPTITPGNLPIEFLPTDTDVQVAAETAAAINNAAFGVTALAVGNEIVLVGPTGVRFANPLTVFTAVAANAINGLQVRTHDRPAQTPEALTVSARWDATDIVYFLPDNLVIQGQPGGMLDTSGRPGGRLAVDANVVVKLFGSRIETDMGAQLIAEAQPGHQVIFTSAHDATYGSGGTFNTVGSSQSSLSNVASVGDWSGLYFAPGSEGSIDYALIAFAGGGSPIAGGIDNFNAVEIRQANVRIADSTLENNAAGLANSNRAGSGTNASTTIYVLGAQPALVNNVIQNNLGEAIDIDLDSLSSSVLPDPGRTTGAWGAYTQYATNQGPLVRLNRLGNNAVNGMVVRGGTLDTSSVWDDTDIVHVLFDEIQVPNYYQQGGLRLQSDTSGSLVVKLQGPNAGFTATGTPLDVNNRIGGSVQIIGTPTYPVVLTALADSTVGAGLTPAGLPQDLTNNNPTSGTQQLLPTIPEVNRGTTIDNDVAVNVVGHLEATIGPGGELGSFAQTGTFPIGVTAQGLTQLLVNQNFLFDYENYIDVGNTGKAKSLSDTSFSILVQAPTLVAPETVVSTGTFVGNNNKTVNWTVTSSIKPGDTKIQNQISLSSTAALGTIRFINYMDEDVPPSPGDDFLFASGTPGQPNFAVFTIDGPQRVGVAQSGIYQPGPQLVNATWVGWAADQFDDLQNAITGAIGSTSYSPTGNINTNNLPPTTDPQLGTIYGPADNTTAFAWDVNPTATSTLITTFITEVPSPPQIAGGQWRSVKFDSNSNDTNVATVMESEPALTSGVDVNNSIATAQQLGVLAPNLKSGDDTQRLGFDIHGAISPNTPGDTDIYAFQAQAGTQVWISAGATSPALDSVIELLNANGTVVARSDNADAEAQDATNAGNALTAGPMLAGELANNLALPMTSDTLTDNTYAPLSESYPGLRNFGSTNPLDAGFRVVLPGAAGSHEYYVRIYSKGPTKLPNGQQQNPYVPGTGLTSGVYDLSVRLQEEQTVPGSMVQNANIRFATNGIEIDGLPANSPLLGETGQAPGNINTTNVAGNNPTDLTPSSANAAIPQSLGNLLTTNQMALSVAGSLTSPTQVDWYSFTLNYDLVQALTSVNASEKTFPAIFDVGYADGLSRANTTISVFDASGRLIYTGRDSNVADQQPQPGQGSNLTNLSHGSVGQLDPYIGTVQLPAGEVGTANSNTYYVAISSDSTLPTALNGTFVAGASQSLVRLEPVNSVNRVVEDHIGTQGGETAQDPSTLTAAFSGNTTSTSGIIQLNSSATPFTLGDTVLYVDQGGGGGQLQTVNPFTGALETTVGGTPGTGLGYGDIAMRNDGQLYGITQGTSDASAGTFNQLSTGNAAVLSSQQDNLQTYYLDITQNPPKITLQNVGVNMDALAFVQPNATNGTAPTRELFAVGHRVAGVYGIPVPEQNVLYQLDPNTGAVLNHTGNPLLTLPTFTDAVGTLMVTEPTIDVVAATDTVNNPPVNNINDGYTFTVSGAGGVSKTFEMDSGPEVQLVPGPNTGAQYIRDGETFKLNGKTFEFDSGPTLVVPNLTQASDFLTNRTTLEVTDKKNKSVIFEFIDDGLPPDLNGIPGVDTAINYQDNESTLTVADDLANAINAAGFTGVTATVVPVPNSGAWRITLVGDQNIGDNTAQGGKDGIISVGNYGVANGHIPVPFEETDTLAQLGQEIVNAVNTGPGAAAGVTASFAIDGAGNGRMTFLNDANLTPQNDFPAPPAQPADVPNEPSGMNYVQGLNGVTSPNIRITFGAGDSIDTITQDVWAALEKALPQFNPTIEATGKIGFGSGNVDLTGVPLPFTTEGGGPGGRITGLASINDGSAHPPLFAVSDTGGFYRVIYNTGGNPNGATLIDALTVKGPNGAPIQFSSLTAGPPDVNGGQFAGMLFGADSSGNLYAFNAFSAKSPSNPNGNPAGTLQPIFANGATSVHLGTSSIVGLAFSTLDYNLWHVTDLLGTMPGHGIPPAPDNSRDPQSNASNQPTQGTNTNASFYFGLENPNASTTLTQSPGNSFQPGAGNYSTNPTVYNTYDLPGGALGSLVTNGFSLANYSAGDKPTLYFNYFLSARSSASNTQNPGTMLDSARVYVSTDNGATWQMVATNNPDLATSNTDPNAELPSFLSASSDIGSNDPRQQVQQLFDNAGTWRQARIDLSNYSGQSNLKLRFDFSTAGTMNPSNPLNQGLPGDSFGNFTNVARGQDTGHEGFFVDDITVGFAERGEMVTGATPDMSFFQTPRNPNVGAPTQILTGPYQLEVREGTEYAATANPNYPDIALTQSFDTNDRLTSGFTISAPPGAALANGETFTISDGLASKTFEFVTNPATVLPGDVAVTFTAADSPATVAHDIAAAVNSITTWKVSAGTVNNPVGPGGTIVTTGNRVDLFGVASLTNSGENRITVSIDPAASTIDENGGVATGTVTRQGPLGAPQNITIKAIDVATGAASTNANFGAPNLTTVNVLIPAGSASATFKIFGQETLIAPGREMADGAQTVELVPSAAGFLGVADTLDVTDSPNVLPQLTLSVAAPKLISENPPVNAPTIQATLTRNSPTTAPLVVNLQSLNPAAASVPLTVTIPAGQATVTFPITPVDNGLTNPFGAQTAVIVASAPNYLSGRDTLTVQDDGDGSGTASSLTVAVNGPDPVTDDAGRLSGKLTITRGGATGDLVVTLTSSDPTLAQFPSSTTPGTTSATTTVTIPDGQSSVTADVTIMDSSVAQYPGTVVFTATGGGFSPISDALDVVADGDDAPATFLLPVDADTPALSVTFPAGAAIPNGNGQNSVVATVTRNTPTTQPLTVFLLSSDPTEATVTQPGGGSTVIIPAGATSATFVVSYVGPFSVNAVENVSIFAAAPGLAGAKGKVLVNPPNGFNRLGDANITRNQGQIIIQDNTISNASKFDIVVNADTRGGSGSIPHPGVARNLDTINGPPQAPPGGLAPGPVITNNLLLASGGTGAILFSGDADPSGEPLAAVPFGRIINNTIYGGLSPSGTGVQVQQNAAPTIINNIFANLSTAISVDASSSATSFHPTVITSNIYQGNTNNVVSANPIIETNATHLAATDALFANAPAGDFYLLQGSKAVDSATDLLPDRSAMVAAKTLTGIPASPVAAPAYDLYGQLRATDPTNPGSSGLGSNNTKDLGAIERVDVTGPTAVLANPLDNDQFDQDPTFNVVHDVGHTLNDFAIQLIDPNGTGIDSTTVVPTEFSLYRNGTPLVEGIDYFFSYDSNTKTAHFTAAAGVWLPGSQYTIFVDNGVKFDGFNAQRTPIGIKDLAGNLLQANSATGFTRYDILLQSAVGDPPVVSVPAPQSVNQGTPLVFSGGTSNPISIFDIEGGSNQIMVTLSTAQGTLTLGSIAGVTFLNGTANGQATITFSGLLANVNNALSGLTYNGANGFAGQASIQVSATDTGTGLTGLGTALVTVVRVDQAPVNTLPGPQSVAENGVNGPLVFSTASGNAISVSDVDAAVSPGNGVIQVTLTASHGTVSLGGIAGLTIISGTGANDVSVTVQGTIPNLNAALNGLSFQPAVNFVGNASLTVSTNDLGNTGLGGPQTTTSVLSINVFHVDQPPVAIKSNTTITVNENAPPTVIDLRTIFSDADFSQGEPFPLVTLSGSTDPTLVNVSVSGTTLTLSYAANQTGTATLTLTATDQGASHAQANATLTVNVLKVEQPPQPHDDTYLYSPNTPLSVTAPGVLANDVEVNGEPMTAVLFNVPAHGKLVLNPDGSFTYQPDPGFNGEDSFVYMADNGTFRTPATVYLDSVQSRWVARMYSEVLGRSAHPNADEVNSWVGQLNAGVSRAQIVNIFVTSPERRSQVINSLYETYLGRAVDAGGLNHWLQVWSANSGPEQVQAGIIGSPEYYITAGNTDAAWVTALYHNLFNRNPVFSEVSYWTGVLASEGHTGAARTNVVLGFVTSDEYRLDLLQGIPNDPNDVGWYLQYLHRPIDSSGAMYWLKQMDSGLPQETILDGILASDEYFNRP